MKLIINAGQENYFEVDVPFDKEGTDAGELEAFRNNMILVYSTYSLTGNVTAIYDFEIEAIQEGCKDWENRNNG